ncbi:MAG: hypothetical protein QM820_01110 [Minicystis sp.]
MITAAVAAIVVRRSRGAGEGDGWTSNDCAEAVDGWTSNDGVGAVVTDSGAGGCAATPSVVACRGGSTTGTSAGDTAAVASKGTDAAVAASPASSAETAAIVASSPLTDPPVLTRTIPLTVRPAAAGAIDAVTARPASLAPAPSAASSSSIDANRSSGAFASARSTAAAAAFEIPIASASSGRGSAISTSRSTACTPGPLVHGSAPVSSSYATTPQPN